MRYFDAFAGIGGFSKGIIKAHESNRNINVQEKRRRKNNPKGVNEKRKRLHSVSSETTISTKNGNNEHANGSIDEGQSNCVGFSEIDKYAIQIYEKHFKHKNYGDITAIDTATLPDFDCFVGGFPCQAFSIAGKRRGFEDTRGTLFFECARIIRDKRPRNFVLENVKGLLSHDEGNTFKTIISTLDELGYFVEWQVLNSKNFGVPQNRERVFIIGHLGGEPKRKVFPIGERNGEHSEKLWQLNNPKFSRKRVYSDRGISPSLTTMQGGNLQPKILDKKGNIKKSKIAATLTGGGHSGGNHSDMDLIAGDSRIRRLTPTECERLQGFPDGWTDCVSDTQRYKTLGNAVTVNVIEEIFKKLVVKYKY